ncbi:MAG: hypothetical protein HQL37_15915 [Alphaproteobacteria bacterium]|nr:hypothetical protein [Alphaproteobacteria bacterium]
MIYDCFTFFNEFEVLRLRLAELWDVVDRFVLVEAPLTHAGKPKPLYFAEARDDFRAFADKIIHVVVDDLPVSADAWVPERFQRDAIVRGLADAAEDDWIFVSDVDEIPRAPVVAEIARSPRSVAGLQMSLSYFKVNFVNIAGSAHMVWAVACRRAAMGSPQGVREARISLMRPDFLRSCQGKAVTIPHAGWHLSYLGNEAHVRQKVQAFAHQEFNRPDILDRLDIDRLLATGDDVFGRDWCRWQVVPLTDYFPAAIVADPAAYAHLIAACP